MSGLQDDGLTGRPTHLRVYREETGDEWVWHIDGADDEGNFTEAVWRFETREEALSEAGRFIAETQDDGGTTWAWDSSRPRRGIRVHAEV